MSEARSGNPPTRIGQAMAWDSIRYSAVWEDHRLVTGALKIHKSDDVLSVTSAGTNVLALLLEEPRSITAVDISPAQNALLALKIGGIKGLDHAAFSRLMGVTPGSPVAEYQRMRRFLPEWAERFWDANVKAIAFGVFRCGRLDRYFGEFQRQHLAELWPSDLVPRLFAAPTLAKQAAIFEREALTDAFIERFVWYFGREMMARRGRDPEQFRYAPDIGVGEYFLQRFRDVCTRLPLAGNFYVERFLTGGYADLGRVPLYLRPEEFDRLKVLVPRVRIVTEELQAFVDRQQTGAFSKTNLSDVFEYMSEEESVRLFESLSARLRPEGRLAYWNLLVERGRPPSLASRLVPLEDEAHALWLEDRSWFYRAFRIEEVQR